MAPGHVRNAGSVPRVGSVLLTGDQPGPRRRRGLRFDGGAPGGIPWWRIAAVVVVAGAVAGVLAWRAQLQARDDRRAAAVRRVVQLGVRAAGGEGRRHAARRDRASVRLR
jgi:hypothetical protein